MSDPIHLPKPGSFPVGSALLSRKAPARSLLDDVAMCRLDLHEPRSARPEFQTLTVGKRRSVKL
jgi:hypothetical protein